MRVTRINPEWSWKRARSVAVGGTYISHIDAVKETKPQENPALHRTLMRGFEEFLESNLDTAVEEIEEGTIPGNHALFARKVFIGSREEFISDWYKAYGPLQLGFAAKLPDEVGVNRGKFRSRRNRIDSFIEEASIVWWVVNVLDRFGGIAAYRNCSALDLRELDISSAGSLVLEVPNPMLTSARWGAAVAARKGEGVGQLKQLGNKNVPSSTWQVPFSALIKWVIEYIDHYLKENTYFKNEGPWDMPRDRFGRKNPAKSKDDTIGHRITTVAQPRNLSGYIWLCIQHQLEETPNIDYYPCKHFEICGQELIGTEKVTRRMYCSESCRVKKYTATA